MGYKIKIKFGYWVILLYLTGMKDCQNIQEFRDYFPFNSNKDVAEKFNSSIRSVIRFARGLGISKDKGYISNLAKKVPRNPRRGDKHPNWKGGSLGRDLVIHFIYSGGSLYLREIIICVRNAEENV